MALPVGTKLGVYVIANSIGSGGMGHVYQAWDERLQRQVAIKTIRADSYTDPVALNRFEREARALAALNHPNLLAVYDIGSQDGVAYIVSELLEGETLKSRLAGGEIPFHRALNFAIQIVRALAAAHEKGLVHRDLKPDNIFLTKDGQLKLLDFGLVKLIHPEESSVSVEDDSQDTTVTGSVVGTPGYMSPEQVRGLNVDHRSDIFSFGAVFYEMLTGRRAFSGETSADVISATLSKDPEISSKMAADVPSIANLLVRHCLEKRPDDRFQSARDLLFDLEALALSSDTIVAPAGRTFGVAPFRRWLVLLVSILAAVGAGLIAGNFLPRFEKRPLPSFSQVTFHRSSISEARFASDGNTVLYNASWAGSPFDILSSRLGGTEARSLDITNADLLSVSSTGELAILLNRQGVEPWFNRGTLARVPLGGGTPREIVEDVQSADWSPDGLNLAIVRHVGGEQELEFPIGKKLFHTSGWLTDVRISPNGSEIALMEHGSQWDDRGWVSMVDLDGNARRLTGEFASEHGLAWSPNGREIWFSATRMGEPASLHVVTLDGKERLAFSAPTNLQLQDISSDGSLLLSSYKDLTSVTALLPGQPAERDLSWLDQTVLFDLSDDGKTLLFQYFGEGSGPNYSSYLRKTDGSPPVRLGEGGAQALAPDGKWAVAILYQTHQTVLLPTGVGQARTLIRNGIIDSGDNRWTSDSQHVVFSGHEPGKVVRCYIQDIAGGKPVPLGPEGLTNPKVSPDGKLMLARVGRNFVIVRLADNHQQPAIGVDPTDRVIRWSGDSRSLFLYREQRIIRLYRVDPLSGHKQLLRQINPADPAGMIGFPEVLVSSDGKSCVYWFDRTISDLYVTRNLLH